MALDKLVDSTQLNNDLASVANAIRTKSGGTGQLAFPAGFVSEIGNISSGTIPTGTKEITVTENGTITEDVTNYASVEITVDVPSSGGVVSGTFVGNNSKTITIQLSFNPDHVMIFSPYDDFGTDNVWNTAVVVYNKNDSYYYGVYLYGTSNIGANKKAVSLVSYQSGNLTISNIPYATRSNKTYYWYAW